jgi:hypothetical protein
VVNQLVEGAYMLPGIALRLKGNKPVALNPFLIFLSVMRVEEQVLKEEGFHKLKCVALDVPSSNPSDYLQDWT